MSKMTEQSTQEPVRTVRRAANTAMGDKKAKPVRTATIELNEKRSRTVQSMHENARTVV